MLYTTVACGSCCHAVLSRAGRIQLQSYTDKVKCCRQSVTGPALPRVGIAKDGKSVIHTRTSKGNKSATNPTPPTNMHTLTATDEFLCEVEPGQELQNALRSVCVNHDMQHEYSAAIHPHPKKAVFVGSGKLSVSVIALLHWWPHWHWWYAAVAHCPLCRLSNPPVLRGHLRNCTLQAYVRSTHGYAELRRRARSLRPCL